MHSIRRRHNITISGSGTTPMLFAHGFGCDQNMWRYMAPAFELDYRVILFDFVGHGNSDRSAYDPQRYQALDGYADDILGICRELDIQNGVFVGHSVSAMIGVLAANREPNRFNNLVLIGPSPRYIAWTVTLAAFRDPTSMACSNPWTAIFSAGPARWRR